MMTAPVGSFRWLLTHDLRLNWRQFTAMFATASPRLALMIAVLALSALHALAAGAIGLIRPMLAGPVGEGAEGGGSTALLVALVCALTWLISQGLLGTSRMLYDRGDLDLLLGSPLPGTRVFAARAVALAVSSLGSIGLLILPVANMGAVLDGPAWLAIYPVLVALALIGTALGAAIAFALFFLVGPRRARLVSSVTAALLAGAFVLSIQIAAMLPEDWREAIAASVGNLGVVRLLWLPTEAVRGNPGAVAGLLIIAFAVFALAVTLMGTAFVNASAVAVEASSEDRKDKPGAQRAVRFRSGLAAALRRKEWRLLRRDPNLFAQLALQIIYTLPVAVVLMRNGSSLSTSLGLSAVTVVIATQVAASLAWIVVSAEDAPELIAAAPVGPHQVDRAKLSAVALPVALIVAAPLVGLALMSWQVAALTALFAAGGATSSAMLNFWHPMPGKRRGMLRRHSQSKLVAMIEHLMALLWAVAVALAVIGSVVALVPLALAVAVLYACRRGWVSGVASAKNQSPAARVVKPAAAIG